MAASAAVFFVDDSVSHDFKIVGYRSGFSEHDGSRTIFVGRQVNRLFNPFGVKLFAGDGVVDVNFGEHLGVCFSALGVDVSDAVGDLLTALAQDVAALEGRGRCQLPD